MNKRLIKLIEKYLEKNIFSQIIKTFPPPFLDKYSTKTLLKISSLKIPSNHHLFYLFKNKLITKNGVIPKSLNYDVVNAGILAAVRFHSYSLDAMNFKSSV